MADRNYILTEGGFLVKRVAYTEPHVKRGVFLLQKACKLACLQAFCGGELGIRTLEAFRLTAFRVLHLRPLGQLSVYVIPFSFEKLFARTDGKNNKIFNFRTEQKLRVYGDFEESILPNSQKNSSAARYDHFDTSPNKVCKSIRSIHKPP